MTAYNINNFFAPLYTSRSTDAESSPYTSYEMSPMAANVLAYPSPTRQPPTPRLPSYTSEDPGIGHSRRPATVPPSGARRQPDSYLPRDFRDVDLERLDYGVPKPRGARRGFKLCVVALMVFIALIAIAVAAAEIAGGQKDAASAADTKQGNGTETGGEQTDVVSGGGKEMKGGNGVYPYPSIKL